MNPNLVPSLIAAGIMLLVAFPIHEFSHALAAQRLGDNTARYMGRLTLDPRVHFDPIGGGILLLGAVLSGFMVGWAKPTPVNPLNLAGGQRGELLVALAGPLSNLVMAAIVAAPLRVLFLNDALVFEILQNRALDLVLQVLLILVQINVLLFVFNLLPIPPLDGYRVLLGFVSPRTAYQLRQYEQYGFLLILLVFLLEVRGVGPLGRIGGAINGFLLGT
jgi:Zn-dependent protease